jgi:hypothetical protein
MDAALVSLPRAVERYREMVADLGNALLNDVERARETIREMVGENQGYSRERPPDLRDGLK